MATAPSQSRSSGSSRCKSFCRKCPSVLTDATLARSEACSKCATMNGRHGSAPGRIRHPEGRRDHVSRTKDHLWTVMGRHGSPAGDLNARSRMGIGRGACCHRLDRGPRPGRWVQAGIQCPTVGTVTGVEHPAPRANGTADRFRRVGARIVFPAGGPAVRGRGSRLTGSGAPAAAPSIIPSPIGAGRLGVGVTHSQRGLPFE